VFVRRRWGWLIVSVVLLALVGAFVSGPAVRAQPGAREARLLVTIVTRNDRGRVLCAIWRGPEGYPTDHARAVGSARDRSIVNRQAHCAFDGLTVGAEYAVAVFHDENGNNQLDRGLFGIPTEGTGASNDASGFMGPPPYHGARFVIPPVAEHTLTIRVGYP
jgi:uncharacterized protein (DUF2141 family)